MRVPKPKDRVYIKSIPEFSREKAKRPLTVEGYILGFAQVKVPYSKGENLEIPLEDLDFAAPEELSGEEKKSLVNKFVLKDYIVDYKVMHSEMAILNKLIDKYPSLEFWRWFEINYQMKSLIWWLGGGKDEIRQAYTSFTVDITDKTLQTHLTTEKIGEDFVLSKKPKTFLDFLA